MNHVGNMVVNHLIFVDNICVCGPNSQHGFSSIPSEYLV